MGVSAQLQVTTREGQKEKGIIVGEGCHIPMYPAREFEMSAWVLSIRTMLFDEGISSQDFPVGDLRD
jgi:hypothetical protein